MQLRLHSLAPTRNLLATRHCDGEFWHYQYQVATFFGNKQSMGKEQLDRKRDAAAKVRQAFNHGEESNLFMEMEKHSFGDVQADDETKQRIGMVGLKSFIDEQGRNRLDLEMPGIGTFVCVVSLEDGGSFIGENYIPAPYEKGTANGHGP